MAEIGLRSTLRSISSSVPVTVDVIELPPERPRMLVFVVYEDEVMLMDKPARQQLMLKLDRLKRATEEAGLRSEVIGRKGRPGAL